MIRALMLVGAFLFGAAPVSWAQSPWRLVDADQIASNTYLILTIPVDDVAALAVAVEEIEARYNVTVSAEWPLNSIAVHCLVIDASTNSDIDSLIADMESDASIRTVQRMQEFEILSETYQDPFFPIQHALADMNAVEAHAQSMGSGVKIGIIDSAVDAAHPDLVDRLLTAKNFVSRSDTQAAEAHGTAVAGVIAANADGVIGMVGVAPKALIIGLRACWQRDGAAGRCSSFSLARAVNFAILNDVDVLNMSLGGPPDPLLEELLQKAVSDGMVVVAALGETDVAAFPASMPGVVSAGRRNLGGIPAPATDIISTAPDGQYRYVSGSSVAAAHVSGVVALLLSKQSNLDRSFINQTLTRAIRNTRDGPLLDANEALNLIGD